MQNSLKTAKLKILLTGGSGFLGQNIINEINKEQYPYTIYNLGSTEVKSDNVVNITCEDVSNFDLDQITEQFDYIIHTLALSNEAYCKDFAYANAVNVDFTRKLLEFSTRQNNLKKFIYISSIIIYSNANPSPVDENGDLYLHYSNYSFTKGVAEEYVSHYIEKFSLPAVIFRLSNIYGPYQEYTNSPFLVPSKIIQGLTENKIEVFSLVPRRDWIYSEDAATAILSSLKAADTGIFNLGSGKGVSVQDIVSEISNQLAVPYSSLEKPITGPTDFYCDIDKIKTTFSWEPKTSLVEGIQKTIQYIKEGLEKQK